VNITNLEEVIEVVLHGLNSNDTYWQCFLSGTCAFFKNNPYNYASVIPMLYIMPASIISHGLCKLYTYVYK